jgi:hypothetical protein
LHLFFVPLGRVFAVGFPPMESGVLENLFFRGGYEKSGATLQSGILAASVGVRYRDPT